MGQRKDAGLLGDQILDINFAGNSLYRRAALVAVLVCQRGQVGFDNVLDMLVVGEDVLIIGNGSSQLAQFLLNFEDFQASQTT